MKTLFLAGLVMLAATVARADSSAGPFFLSGVGAAASTVVDGAGAAVISSYVTYKTNWAVGDYDTNHFFLTGAGFTNYNTFWDWNAILKCWTNDLGLYITNNTSGRAFAGTNGFLLGLTTAGYGQVTSGNVGFSALSNMANLTWTFVLASNPVPSGRFLFTNLTSTNIIPIWHTVISNSAPIYLYNVVLVAPIITNSVNIYGASNANQAVFVHGENMTNIDEPLLQIIGLPGSAYGNDVWSVNGDGGMRFTGPVLFDTTHTPSIKNWIPSAIQGGYSTMQYQNQDVNYNRINVIGLNPTNTPVANLSSLGTTNGGSVTINNSGFYPDGSVAPGNYVESAEGIGGTIYRPGSFQAGKTNVTTATTVVIQLAIPMASTNYTPHVDFSGATPFSYSIGNMTTTSFVVNFASFSGNLYWSVQGWTQK